MDFYTKIKEELVNNEIKKQVQDYSKNRSDLSTYYNVGKLLVEAQGGKERAKYGDGLIKKYSIRLMSEIDKKYSYRNLMNMRKFYILFQNEKVNALRSQLTWSHYRELLFIDNTDEINYYIDISVKQNISYRELHHKIKNKEYERLDDNTKNKLITNSDIEVSDFIKNPIIIKSSYNNDISEKALKQIILENISNFLSELGDGFSYIKDEYKIKLGSRYNYIDLLLFNYIYNCFVVVELKITELRKEHIGQIESYMNYINKNIKTIEQNNTIGIIICKKDNMYVMEYCSDDRVFRTVYELSI